MLFLQIVIVKLLSKLFLVYFVSFKGWLNFVFGTGLDIIVEDVKVEVLYGLFQLSHILLVLHNLILLSVFHLFEKCVIRFNCVLTIGVSYKLVKDRLTVANLI